MSWFLFGDRPPLATHSSVNTVSGSRGPDNRCVSTQMNKKQPSNFFFSGADCKPPKFKEQDEEEEEEVIEGEECKDEQRNCSAYRAYCIKSGR